MAKISVAGIAADDVLNCLPDGVAVLSPDLAIVWANQCFNDWFGGVDRTGEDFYSALGNPEIQGVGKCPLQACISSGRKSGATLKTDGTIESKKTAYYYV
ncbi:MAG: PAS domain-containing protein, partial [Pirellula sp.]